MHMYMNPVEGVKATICTINSHLTRLQQQLCGIRHLSFSLFFPPTNILLTLMTQNIMDSSSKPFCAQSLPRVSQSFKSFCLLFFTHMSLWSVQVALGKSISDIMKRVQDIYASSCSPSGLLAFLRCLARPGAGDGVQGRLYCGAAQHTRGARYKTFCLCLQIYSEHP